MTVERREGPTPAGGSYSEAIYDGDGRLVEIVEYDASGVPLARTYAEGRLRSGTSPGRLARLTHQTAVPSDPGP